MELSGAELGFRRSRYGRGDIRGSASAGAAAVVAETSGDDEERGWCVSESDDMVLR